MTNAVKTIIPEDLERRIKEAGKADLRLLTDGINKADVVAVGEYHFNHFVRHHLIGNLIAPDFLGINAYGAEASVKYRRQFQKVYNSGGRYIAPNDVFFGPTDNPKDDESYRALAYSFAKNHIPIFPFDIREFSTHNGKIIPKEVMLMAKIIKRMIRRYGKTLVLVGDIHARRVNGELTIADYLEGYGCKCITLMYYGGYVTHRGYTPEAKKIEQGARNVNRGKDEFILKNSLDMIPPGFDYIIHLPQQIAAKNKEIIYDRITRADR